MIYDYSVAYKNQPIERGHLLRALTPLYLAKVASFVLETEHMLPAEFEEKIENLCICFERLKPYLVSRWNGKIGEVSLEKAAPDGREAKKMQATTMGV